MEWKIYKEGQGKWARNTVAALVALFAAMLAVSMYSTLPDPSSHFEIVNHFLNRIFGVEHWPIDYRIVLIAPVVIAILIFGYRQYNSPRWSDFLIDTENELKNRVTWPSRKEEVNHSIVVVVTVVIIGAFTFLIDMLLNACSQWVFHQMQ
ncbi:MAG: preprotein translocase subunit SecE [Planctomycetes bacterium]|nr:preprotein translocase subunit SecE [Planctomycetota bacterium]